MGTKLLKRYILDSVNDARLLIAERELNELSDNAESILIRGDGSNRISEILSELRIRFDEIDLTKIHKVLYCIFYNQLSANKLNIEGLNAICKFFDRDRYPELIQIFGLYQNDKLGDGIELAVIFE